MLIVRIALVLVAAAAGWGAGKQCSPAAVSAAESSLRAVEREIAAADSAIARLEGELRGITGQIEAIRDEAESNPIRRRRLESLLGESRAKAEDLESLGTDRAVLAARRDRVAGGLRECYDDSLSTTLRRLVASVRDRRYDRAKDEMAAVRALEDRLAWLGGQETAAEDYPLISEGFIESSLESVEDELFLIDTIDDLLDKAGSDSVRAAKRLPELQESIRLKKDLLQLVNQARQGGLDRGAFFESFGRDDVEGDIKALETEASAVEAALAEAAGAIAYYRDRKSRLTATAGRREE